MHDDNKDTGPENADRRAFMQMAAGAVAGAGAVGMGPRIVAPGIAAAQTSSVQRRGGHLYMQTNETSNAIVHYRRSADGVLAEHERVSTGGKGSGVFKPISGQESAPNAFEGAGSVILAPDRRFLFTT